MRYFIRKVSSLGMWQPSKKQGDFPTMDHKKQLIHDITKDKFESPSYWLAHDEQEIERVVSGLILLNPPKPNKLKNFRFIAFEEMCFLTESGELLLLQDRDEAFPIASLEEHHYIFKPEASRNELILARIIQCHGFLGEYRKKPVGSSDKSLQDILKECVEEVKDEYKSKVIELTE